MNLKQFAENRKLIVSFAILLFLSGGIFVATYLTKQPQLLQKEATGQGVVLSLSPKTGSYSKGEEFIVEILLDTDDKPVVGVDVSLSFDKEKLQVKSIVPGSLFQDQIVFKNEIKDNKILLSLGSFTPFTGNGVYGTVRFQAIEVGEAIIAFNQTPETKVAQEDDGNILDQTINGSYTIIETGSSTPTLTPTPTLVLTGTPTPTPTPTPTISLTPTPSLTLTPTQTPIPTPNCPEQAEKGDYDCNGEVDEQDFEAWRNDYLEGKTTLPLFEYWRRAFFD